MADMSPETWAATLLRRLGIHQTPGAVQGVVGWVKAEGGHYHNDARFNPLNTTQGMPGAGNTGSQGNIKVFRSWGQGLDATVKTLRNGRYGGILAALRQGNPDAVAHAVGGSPWGTSAGLIEQTIASTPRRAGVHAAGGAAVLSSATRGGAPGGAATAPAPAVPGETPLQAGSAVGVDVLTQMLAAKPQVPVASGAVPTPAFLAGPRLPSGYQLAASGGGPAPKPDVLSQALSAVAGSGGGAVDLSAPAAPGGGADASPQGVSSAGGGAGAGAAVSWVRSKVGDPGSREASGANDGKLASYLNSRFGMKGQPWCAMFTSVAVTKGGAPASARTASVAQVRQKAQQGVGYERGFVHAAQAQPGDLVLFGDSHIAMVTGVQNGRISYVGGNQSNNVTRGSTSGQGVDIVRPKYGARR